MMLEMKIKNLGLKLKYLFFKRWTKKLDVSKRKLCYFNDCKSLETFNVKGGEFYNNNDVWFSRDTVSITPEGISIKCIHTNQYHVAWNGKKVCKWESGLLDTRDKFMASKGIWEIEAKVCAGWPAIWLLKNAREVPGYTREQITPEIDVFETIKGMIRHTLHYGYDNVIYRRIGIGSSIKRNDNAWHKFAVELLDNGYKFYIDGMLTAEFINDDPEFVTDAPNYLLLNNAAHTSDEEDTEFIIKSIKFWK